MLLTLILILILMLILILIFMLVLINTQQAVADKIGRLLELVV